VVEPAAEPEHVKLSQSILRLRIRQQELLAELGVIALERTTFSDLLESAVRVAAEGLEAEFCKVLEFQPAENRLLMVAGIGWDTGLVGVASVGADLAGADLRARDCLFAGEWAVYLAEARQTPVIVLSDQALGQAYTVIDPKAERPPPLPRRTGWGDDQFKRYAVGPDPITAMPAPGTPGGQWVGEGLTHNETGVPVSGAAAHVAQIDKRAKKIAQFDPGQLWGDVWGEGDTAILTFGSGIGAAQEAAHRLTVAGQSARVISLRVLSPLPKRALADALAGVKRVIVMEQNHGAQLYHHLLAHQAIPPEAESFARPEPLPFRSPLRSPRIWHDGERTVTLVDTTPGAPQTALTASDFHSGATPVWCPGCGDYGVLSSPEHALAAHGRPPHDVVLVSGIGCSSRLPAYTTCYGFHGVHGRALPFAAGVKMARPDLVVIAVGGNGDGYSIGGNHFVHACQRNLDMLYLVMDNPVYGMTKGQPSPTTEADWDSDIAPGGLGRRPLDPLAVAIAAGATFIARAFSGRPHELADLIVEGIRWPGFAFAYAAVLADDGFGLRVLFRDHRAKGSAPSGASATLADIEQEFAVCSRP
jgi:hypothetical protein